MTWQKFIPLSKSHFWQYCAVIGLLTLAYYITTQLAFLTLELQVQASPVCPPARIALTALLLLFTPLLLLIKKCCVEANLQETAQRENTATAREFLLREVALRIRRSLNLEQILQTTVAEVRQFLGSDRVFIAKFDEITQDCSNLQACSPVTYLQGQIIAESVDNFYPSLLPLIVQNQTALQEWKSFFEQGGVRVVEDTTTTSVSPQLADFYSQYQVKATLGVAIFVGEKLFGTLVVNQCDQPRLWLEWEIDWLVSLATQVAIAIQQAELYRQIIDLNTHLESQVEKRTQELCTKMTELQELNQLKDVFLQAVSHDLRTSLLGMSMVFHNLYNCAGESVTISRSLLKRMINSSDRQLNLINSLLEDHFHEQRQLELNCKLIQLDKLIQDLITDYSSMLAQNKAILNYTLPENCPLLAIDFRQIRCVLENLLTNAVKHNPPGLNLKLQITLEDKMLRCTLQDDGVGMSQEQQNSLFKLYIRGLHTKHLTGIGLGLYQCRSIIHAHGGEIGVISNPGAGSTFWFTLPLAVPFF
jgi:signal transduction histidine kinase